MSWFFCAICIEGNDTLHLYENALQTILFAGGKGKNMKYIILVSHGGFAAGLKSSLEMFARKRNDLIASGLPDGKSAEEFGQIFAKDIECVKPDDGIVLLADIIGGSPLTTALNVLSGKGLLKNTIVFGGMNLPMAITTALMKDNMSNEELAKQILHEGSEAMKQFEISQSDEDEDI